MGYGLHVGQFFRATKIMAVGKVHAPATRLRVEFSGIWEIHRSHGKQLIFEEISVLASIDPAGLTRSLASDTFPGLGDKLAERQYGA
jgi:hypothetical protein